MERRRYKASAAWHGRCTILLKHAQVAVAVWLSGSKAALGERRLPAGGFCPCELVIGVVEPRTRQCLVS